MRTTRIAGTSRHGTQRWRSCRYHHEGPARHRLLGCLLLVASSSGGPCRDRDLATSERFFHIAIRRLSLLMWAVQLLWITHQHFARRLPPGVARTYSKQAQIDTIRRGGPWTDSPNILQHDSTTSPNILSAALLPGHTPRTYPKHARTHTQDLLCAAPVLGQTPRTYPKITHNILLGAFVEQVSRAGHRARRNLVMLATFGQLWTKLGQTWFGLGQGSDLAKIGQALPTFSRIGRPGSATITHTCSHSLFEQIVRGATIATHVRSTITHTIGRLVRELFMKYTRGVCPRTGVAEFVLGYLPGMLGLCSGRLSRDLRGGLCVLECFCISSSPPPPSPGIMFNAMLRRYREFIRVPSCPQPAIVQELYRRGGDTTWSPLPLGRCSCWQVCPRVLLAFLVVLLPGGKLARLRRR